MILRIFALYDLKSGAHSTPFFMHHVGEAVRACIDLGSDVNTTVGRHPADFTLHELGTFDTDTGLITPHQPVSHGAVVTMLPQRRQPVLFEQGGDPVSSAVRVMRPSSNGMEPHGSVVEG